jgi:murein DD-endopeptidase MepM/ murein hydrolase activator NlpD
MHAEELEPSLLEQTAKQAAEHAARELAKQALVKVGAVLGAKAGVIIAVVLAVIAIVVLLIVLIVAVAGAAFQSSTAVWPVPVATATDGTYTASGWIISSRYGWRDNPMGGVEFHDGIDLANPQGMCPFGYHCGAPAMFDGHITYVGWDMAAAGDPSKTGGGELVILRNGNDDHETVYAHLEPYRLYVRLEGKIKDRYDRDEYRPYKDYQTIGRGELKPDLANGGIEMACLNDMPNFIATRTGGGSVVFLYDRPASCTTTVVWGERGGKWEGWTPDDPSARWGDERRAELHWQTQIEPGKVAKDVALRFRAHLVPPDPPPSPTAIPTPVGTVRKPLFQSPSIAAMPRSGTMQTGQGSVGIPDDERSLLSSATPGVAARNGKPRSCARAVSGWIRCTWSFADIPTEQERFAQQPDPWIVAAQAAPRTEAAQSHEHDADTEGLTVGSSPAPALLRTPQPTLTATPTPPRAQEMQVSERGMGGLGQQRHALQATAAAQSQATISPGDRQWVAPGGSATWTIALTNNQRGSWMVHVADHDPRLIVNVDASCQPIGGNGLLCPLPGSVTALQIRVFAGGDADGLSADLLIAVTDADNGGGGPVIGELRMRIGVGVQPTATTTPLPLSPTPVLLPTPPPMPTPGGDDRGGTGENGSPDCAPRPLVRLPNVRAPQPKLVEPAAASFAAVRQEISERTGVDALAILADVLRQPSFSTNKPGVLSTSWHKAGRAVDLNTGGPFVRVPEGTEFRLYVNNVDITAIFEAHGWQRIPVQGDVLEWWHYEYHPDGIAWTSAMLQVWDLPTLQAAFPEIAWETIGCSGGSNTGTDPLINPQEREQICVLGSPSFGGSVEYLDGCGPPVRVGDRAYQLDTRLGFVGLSGSTTGPHLHLGMKVKSYTGAWPAIDICTPEYLDGRAMPSDANCYTDMADPLAFLPRAPGSMASGGGGGQPAALQLNTSTTPTPIIPEGAPYQLPPPNYPNSLVFTPPPAATPVGQYWSPYADGGQYGGGGIGEWFCSMWSGWPWCN